MRTRGLETVQELATPRDQAGPRSDSSGADGTETVAVQNAGEGVD